MVAVETSEVGENSLFVFLFIDVYKHGDDGNIEVM
jgi:hypothetical protein